MISLSDLNPLKIIPFKEKLGDPVSFRDGVDFGSGKPDSRANRRQVYADNSAPSGDVRSGDLWFDTNDGNTVYRWNGTAWGNVRDTGIGSTDWPDVGDSLGNKPANNADVTSSNTAANASAYTGSTISTSYTAAKATDPNADQTSANTAAAITGQGTLATENTVGTTLIDNLAVTAAKVASAAIETAKLSDLAVTGAKIAAGTITANEIAADTITANEIAASTITAAEIAAGTITANEMNVSQLSAISADIGSITSGTITGATIQTSSSANTGVKLTSSGAAYYGTNSCYYYNTSGTLIGYVGGDGSTMIVSTTGSGTETSVTGSPLSLCGTADACIQVNSYDINIYGDVLPNSDNDFDLGSSSLEWRNLYIDGTAQVDALRIDQTPVAATPTPTHTFTVSLDGTTYRVPCVI